MATDNKKEKDGSILTNILITVGIILAVLVLLIILIKKDVGSFGSTVLRPILGKVPVVKMILPPEKKRVVVDPNYDYATVEEAIEQIKELEGIIKFKESEMIEAQANLDSLEKEVTRLRSFEAMHSEYLANKKKFDEEVVFNDKSPDIEEYKEYYEQISPGNAEEIYRLVMEQYAIDEELQKLIKSYNEMKPANAAAILEKMTSNMSLVVKILRNVSVEQRANILAAMDATIAAKVTKELTE